MKIGVVMGSTSDCVDIQLLNVAVREEARHIKIVNRHIEENAARHFNICGIRRFGVAGRDFQNMRLADFARIVCLADSGEIVVKAAVEADLEFHLGMLCERICYRLNFCDRMVNGLFTEYVLAHFNLR